VTWSGRLGGLPAGLGQGMKTVIQSGCRSRITPRTGESGFEDPFSSTPPTQYIQTLTPVLPGPWSTQHSKQGRPPPPPLLCAVDERRDRITVPKGGGDRPWSTVLHGGHPVRCSGSTCLCVQNSTNLSHREIGGVGGGFVCHGIQGRQVGGRVEAARPSPSPILPEEVVV
jgi:hypothetical protein